MRISAPMYVLFTGLFFLGFGSGEHRLGFKSLDESFTGHCAHRNMWATCHLHVSTHELAAPTGFPRLVVEAFARASVLS